MCGRIRQAELPVAVLPRIKVKVVGVFCIKK